MWCELECKKLTVFSVHRWPRRKQRFLLVELWVFPPRPSSWGIIWVCQMRHCPCTTLERGRRVLPCPTVHPQLTSYWKVTTVEVSQYRRALTLPQLKLLPGNDEVWILSYLEKFVVLILTFLLFAMYCFLTVVGNKDSIMKHQRQKSSPATNFWETFHWWLSA